MNKIKETGVWSLEDASGQHQYSQNLATYIAEQYKGEKLLDIGCGNGAYVDYFNTNNIDTIGVDGTDFPGSGRKVWDLSEPFPDDFIEDKRQIMCLEVAEHIPQKYEKIFLDNVIKFSKDQIIMSWAVPGQGGHGHVNEQSHEYVIDIMKTRGFYFDLKATDEIRNYMKFDHCWWFKNSLFVFKKNSNI
jgi:hypothetical protein